MIVEKKNPHFESLYQVCKNIVNVREKRGHLKNFIVKDGKLYATDGRSMFVRKVDSDVMPDGFYHPESVSPSKIILSPVDPFEFPDPSGLEATGFKFNAAMSLDAGIIGAVTRIPLNSKHILIADTLGLCDVTWKDDKSPVLFRELSGDSLTRFYVMPLQIPTDLTVYRVGELDETVNPFEE